MISKDLVPAGTVIVTFPLAFVVAVTAVIGLLTVGVVRRWRWLFWLILIAFLAGVLRVPASILELAGKLPPTGPTWYVLVQATIGLVQFTIGLAMLSGFRWSGVWGPFHMRGGRWVESWLAWTVWRGKRRDRA